MGGLSQTTPQNNQMNPLFYFDTSLLYQRNCDHQTLPKNMEQTKNYDGIHIWGGDKNQPYVSNPNCHSTINISLVGALKSTNQEKAERAVATKKSGNKFSTLSGKKKEAVVYRTQWSRESMGGSLVFFSASAAGVFLTLGDKNEPTESHPHIVFLRAEHFNKDPCWHQAIEWRWAWGCVSYSFWWNQCWENNKAVKQPSPKLTTTSK